MVVETAMLASANSWLGIGRHSSAVVGPAIAAIVYGTAGPSTVWGLEALSFVVSASALWLARPRRLAPGPRRGVGRELAEGFRYVASVPWLWRGVTAAGIVLMVATAPFTALLPTIVDDHYGRSVGAYGVLFSLMAAGMVAGSLAWARWEPAAGLPA